MKKDEEYIDIHTHTEHSDGTSTVENSLKEAEKLQLRVLSISDHNTVSAYDEVQDLRGLYSGIIIPGVEITTTYNGEVIEVLGYGFNIEMMKRLLEENVYTFYEKQIRESKLNLETFKSYGVTFSEEFEKRMTEHPEELFNPNKTSSRQAFLDEMRKYPENARFFDSEEQMAKISIRDFSRNIVYNPKSKLYVNQSPLYTPLDKAIEMIHQSGGLAFLAHLYEYSPTIASSLDDIISGYDLDGIECQYATFKAEQTRFLEGYCNKHGLYQSCGSDFHGYKVKPNNHMGLGTEGKRMLKSTIMPWMNRIKNILLPDEPEQESARKRFVATLRFNPSIVENVNETKKQDSKSLEEDELSI